MYIGNWPPKHHEHCTLATMTCTLYTGGAMTCKLYIGGAMFGVTT